MKTMTRQTIAIRERAKRVRKASQQLDQVALMLEMGKTTPEQARRDVQYITSKGEA